jgi:hypothetical protein
MSHDPGFVAALELAIGARTEVIPTDSSRLSMSERSFGPRAQAWASIAEHIDSRKTTDWILPDLTLSIWQPSTIVRGGGDIQFFPRSTPLQLEAERPWSDAPVFPVHLAAGSEIELALPDYTLPQGQASRKCTYIARAGVQIWMGRDTFAFQRPRLRVTSKRRIHLFGSGNR